MGQIKLGTRSLLGTACFLLVVMFASPSQAQLSAPREVPFSDSKVPSLEEQLINTLRATTEERKAYLRLVVQLVDNGQLDRRLVIAIQRYAQRKNSTFPFPYFERAMRFETEKRGITLPPVRLLAGSPSTYLGDQ